MPEYEEDYDQDFGDCYLKWIIGISHCYVGSLGAIVWDLGS